MGRERPPNRHRSAGKTDEKNGKEFLHSFHLWQALRTRQSFARLPDLEPPCPSRASSRSHEFPSLRLNSGPEGVKESKISRRAAKALRFEAKSCFHLSSMVGRKHRQDKGQNVPSKLRHLVAFPLLGLDPIADVCTKPRPSPTCISNPAHSRGQNRGSSVSSPNCQTAAASPG